MIITGFVGLKLTCLFLLFFCTESMFFVTRWKQWSFSFCTDFPASKYEFFTTPPSVCIDFDNDLKIIDNKYPFLFFQQNEFYFLQHSGEQRIFKLHLRIFWNKVQYLSNKSTSFKYCIVLSCTNDLAKCFKIFSSENFSWIRLRHEWFTLNFCSYALAHKKLINIICLLIANHMYFQISA